MDMKVNEVERQKKVVACIELPKAVHGYKSTRIDGIWSSEEIISHSYIQSMYGFEHGRRFRWSVTPMKSTPVPEECPEHFFDFENEEVKSLVIKWLERLGINEYNFVVMETMKQ